MKAAASVCLCQFTDFDVDAIRQVVVPRKCRAAPDEYRWRRRRRYPWTPF
jgi:hypothetical protein